MTDDAPAFEVAGIAGLPDVTVETDLAAALQDAVAVQAPDADVVCVASTVVAKSEGRTRRLVSYEPSEEAEALAAADPELSPRFAEAVLRESTELLLRDPFLLAVTPHGHVAPNAGVDRSNVAGEDVIVLFPEEPDESARRLSDAVGVPVIVTDTCGRPFRCGQTGVAVGWHGLAPIRDWRGTEGRHGHELEATEEAVADELAGAANLAMGEAGGGVPAAAVRGVRDVLDRCTGETLFRPEDDDVVRDALRQYRRE